MELIDRQALVKQMKETYCTDCENYNGIKCRACWIDDAIGTVDDAPAVDAAPVVHGRWVKRTAIVFDDEMVGYRCSECKTTWDAETDYCPHCGAKMDGGAEDGKAD